MRLLDDAARHPNWWLTAIATLVVVLVGAADYLSGGETTFSIFYLLPVFTVSAVGRPANRLFVGALAAVTWCGAEFAALGFQYAHVATAVWNFSVRVGMLLMLGYLASALRRSLLQERELSRTDALTGLANRRGFFEDAEVALAQAVRQRSPLTIAYMDIDNFKRLNDGAGHAAGDALLRTVGATLSDRLRGSDIIGRLGGDEFAVLLSATSSDAAEDVLVELHARLTQAVRDPQWDVGISMGAVAFSAPPASLDELLAAADATMYEVKSGGRNAILLRRRETSAAA